MCAPTTGGLCRALSKRRSGCLNHLSVLTNCCSYCGRAHPLVLRWCQHSLENRLFRARSSTVVFLSSMQLRSEVPRPLQVLQPSFGTDWRALIAARWESVERRNPLALLILRLAWNVSPSDLWLPPALCTAPFERICSVMVSRGLSGAFGDGEARPGASAGVGCACGSPHVGRCPHTRILARGNNHR